MHYTLEEAVERQDFTLLSREQETEMLSLLQYGPRLFKAVRSYDVAAGFMNEDEAHEPLGLLRNYETALLEGLKADRKQALKLLEEDLTAYAMRAVHTAEYGMGEWKALVSLTKEP